MHLVAEIIFIFLIVYLTGSSSKWQKKTAFFYSFPILFEKISATSLMIM